MRQTHDDTYYLCCYHSQTDRCKCKQWYAREIDTNRLQNVSITLEFDSIWILPGCSHAYGFGGSYS